ncbi:MAG: response regulator [Planctomycetota bacterium]
MIASRRKILIVDDNELNLDILEELLGDRFDLRRARSGEEALATLAAFDAELVLLDVLMPGIDGYETCRRITQRPESQATKVILVSARGATAERLRGYSVGASDFVVKPFDPDELSAKVDVFLALKAAQDESRAKSDFVAHMSHEIRTPMTAILGYAENLRDEALSDQARHEAIDAIWRNGQHLLELINNILDLSKFEASGVSVVRAPCNPVEIIAEVVDMMRPKAESCRLALTAECEGAIPTRIESDRTRLKQILVNLVGNALKFTEKGGVRVLARLVGGDAPRLEVDVVDTGIGIDPERIDALCQPFVQADASVTRRFGGSGLGLSISRHLARMLGGDLSIRSTRGRGSTFTMSVATGPIDGVPLCNDLTGVRLPRAGSADRSLPRIECRVLLAEDGADNQRLLSFVLHKAGARVVVVGDGQQAVEAALAAHSEGSPFGVVLMDMQMPVLDGYTATARLRAAGYTAPIIGVTAHAMPEDRARCARSGCDRFVAKPIDREALIRTIHELVTVQPCR